MISTRDLSLLPDLDGFRRLTRSLAALDAVICPGWEYRYYSFDARWADGEMMASMRDGSGDQWFAIICTAGTALHGLAHEAPCYQPDQPQPWVFAGLPVAFHDNLLGEPAFDTANSTFCIWRLAKDGSWHCGSSEGDGEPRADDGSAALLEILDGDPRRYVEYAREIHEMDLSPHMVQAVYRHESMTPELATGLRQDVDHATLTRELDEIGYPERS